MSTKRIVASVVAISFVIIAALGAIVLLTTNKITNPDFAVSAMSDAKSIFDNIKTSEIKMNTSLDMSLSLVGLGDPQVISTTAEAYGAQDSTDPENLKVRVDQTSYISGQSIQVSQVFIGDDLYISIDNSEYTQYNVKDLEGTIYEGFEATFESLQDQKYMQYVQDSSDYEYLGEDEINGVAAYKYRLLISDEIFGTIMKSQLDDVIGELEALGISKDDWDFSFDTGDTYVWISQSDSKPLMEKLENFSATMEIKGQMKIEITDMDVEVEYLSVNEPVTIEAPVI